MSKQMNDIDQINGAEQPPQQHLSRQQLNQYATGLMVVLTALVLVQGFTEG